MGKTGMCEVYNPLILCLSVLIQAYNTILTVLYPIDLNPNFWCNPRFKMLRLVYNGQ